MNPRTERPEKGNKFYITKAAGGYSTAIKGNPQDADCNVLANCVGYAVGRFHEIANRPQYDLLDAVNAENLFANAKNHGLQTGAEPQLGAMIVWQKGATLSSSDGAGHVGVVEKIAPDGTITTSESEWGGRAFVNRTYAPPYSYGTGYKLLGFVYQPETQPVRVIREGDHGAEVELMQARLHALGYMRRNEVDGDFGKITKGAVLCFQLEHGLEPDGVCGPATQAKLAK